jgi:adenine-specific DNA glycosylase
VALVAEDGRRILLARRVPRTVFGGLWEPPGTDGRGIRSARSLADRIVHYDCAWPLRRVRHLLTHRDVRVAVFALERATLRKGPDLPSDYDDIAWFDLERKSRPAMSALAMKILGRK